MLINIQDDIIRLNSAGLLDSLLVDKTTKKNIMWATDAYAERGSGYERNEEIASSLITGTNNGIIKTRARKEFEQQSARTRKHAEVFTPMWVCKMMNDYADQDWLAEEGIISANSKIPNHIVFPDDKKWQKYVDSRRLEITCGEAPYLVSRYDVANGEVVPIENRIGLLDRKLRVVTENTTSENEWVKWAIRALQSIYGYEFQGDNLLIARVNVVMTFAEYLEARCNRQPSQKEMKTAVNIASWNLWQMDGLTGAIPYQKASEASQQISIFELLMMEGEQEEEQQPDCVIYDWRAGKSLTFNSMKEGSSK